MIFLGSSKGATGALLWSSIANGSKRKLKISCLVFSPQTMLYPRNETLAILPSYRRWAHSRNHKNYHVINFRFYGDIIKHMLGRTPRTVVYFCKGNKMDRLEATPLMGMPGIKLVPLNLPFHGAIMPFVTDVSDVKKLSLLIEKLYLEAQTDTDLAASLPDDPAVFRAALSGMMSENLRDMIKDHVKQRRVLQDFQLRTRNLAIRIIRRFKAV